MEGNKKINKPVMQIPPIKKTDGTWVRNNEQKHKDLLDIWNIYSNCKRDRMKQKRRAKTLFKKKKKSNLPQQLKSRTKQTKAKTLKKHRDLIS